MLRANGISGFPARFRNTEDKTEGFGGDTRSRYISWLVCFRSLPKDSKFSTVPRLRFENANLADA